MSQKAFPDYHVQVGRRRGKRNASYFFLTFTLYRFSVCDFHGSRDWIPRSVHYFIVGKRNFELFEFPHLFLPATPSSEWLVVCLSLGGGNREEFSTCAEFRLPSTLVFHSDVTSVERCPPAFTNPYEIINTDTIQPILRLGCLSTYGPPNCLPILKQVYSHFFGKNRIAHKHTTLFLLKPNAVSFY